jgi:hypothetical protein
MQTAPRFWTSNTPRRTLRPVRLRVRPRPLEGTTPRCHRCDIPLGAYLCPNPLCPEQHGLSAGALCAWCLHNDEARSALMDIPWDDGHTEAAHMLV